jgi:hypothetical protein
MRYDLLVMKLRARRREVAAQAVVRATRVGRELRAVERAGRALVPAVDARRRAASHVARLSLAPIATRTGVTPG